MAEPRKVPFVTLSAFSASAPPPGSEARKRRLDADTEPSRETGLGAPEASGSGKAPRKSETVRINIPLAESTELSYPEYSYSELLQVLVHTVQH